MKTSTELKAELEELTRESNVLATEAKELEQRLKVIEDRKNDLDGSRLGYRGLIKGKIAEIEEAESREKDEACPRPIWIKPPTMFFTTDKVLVVSRITKKRITLKEIGGREVHFSKETGTTVYDDYTYDRVKLDVNATINTWDDHAKNTKQESLKCSKIV
jgi:hypothetical protein